MRIEGKTFYLLKTAKRAHVFNKKDEAIDELREVGSSNFEETLLFEVDFSEDEWSADSVPWSEIAAKLLEDR